MKLADTLPTLSAELAELLSKKDRPDLAAQVAQLKIVDRCRCEVSSSFYTQPKPKEVAAQAFARSQSESSRGRFAIDVVDDEIMFVEVFDANRRQLLAALP